MMNNETKNAFANMQNTFAAATAESGGGTPWPKAGAHQCYLVGLHTATGKFRQSDGQEFPAATIQFEYELCEDPDRPSPLQWRGAIFSLPTDPGQITLEGSKKRAEIEMNRLKGHLTVLLGSEPTNMVSALEQVSNMIQSDQAVVCNVKCNYREVGDRTYKTEYIRELLSGAAV